MTERSERRVLVVDDEEMLQRCLVRLLKRIGGLVCEPFGDGREGVERFRAAPFDLAILDINMPAMNGVEVAQRLRETRPALPLIFITACPDSALAVLARALSPLAVFAKPWCSATLSDLVRRVG